MRGEANYYKEDDAVILYYRVVEDGELVKKRVNGIISEIIIDGCGYYRAYIEFFDGGEHCMNLGKANRQNSRLIRKKEMSFKIISIENQAKSYCHRCGKNCTGSHFYFSFDGVKCASNNLTLCPSCICYTITVLLHRVFADGFDCSLAQSILYEIAPTGLQG